IERRPLGNGPALEHAVALEPEVVVQAGRPVLLDDEPSRASLAPFLHLSGRFGRAGETALASILVETHAEAPQTRCALPPRGGNVGELRRKLRIATVGIAFPVPGPENAADHPPPGEFPAHALLLDRKQGRTPHAPRDLERRLE